MASIHLSPLYQTVKDKGSHEMIERSGPIYGRENTWLGKGYYFWDGAIELAHWWGSKHCHGSYVICEATADFDQKEYFDLVGNSADLKLFRDILNALRKKHSFQDITVSAVLNEMRKHTSFPYRVIRARSEHYIPGGDRIKFVENDGQVMITLPAIQVCFSDAKYIKNYHVIFPKIIEKGEVV